MTLREAIVNLSPKALSQGEFDTIMMKLRREFSEKELHAANIELMMYTDDELVLIKEQPLTSDCNIIIDRLLHHLHPVDDWDAWKPNRDINE